MQKINGALTAGSINGALIGKTVTSLPNEAICINCAVTIGAFTGTSESPIKHKFIGCAITFTGDTANYSGQVEITFIDCVFTNSATATNIKGDGYSVVYITNCSGSIKVGTNESTEIPIFYINGSPDLTVARFSSTYQYADIYIDGEIEIYNKNLGYTSLNGAGAQYSWYQADGTSASVIANGIEAGYYVTGFRFGKSKRIAVHYNAIVDAGSDTYYYFENEVVCDIDGDFGTVGYIRGATVPRLMTADATSPEVLNMTFRVLSSGRVDFLGAEYEGYTADTSTLTIHIDKIRGIL